MRIIGGRDYYDGMAFSSDGKVLSLLVYHRHGSLVMDGRTMHRMLGARDLTPRLDVEPLTEREPKAAGMRAVVDALMRGLGPSRARCGEIVVTFSPTGSLFCGQLRRGILLRATNRRTRNTTTADWCWTADAFEEAIAFHGMHDRSGRHREWFEPEDRSHAAKAAGLAVATLDPTDGHHPRGTWRLDAPTMGRMCLQQVIPAERALRELAHWIGGAPVVNARTRAVVAGDDARDRMIAER
jgi:hypothetical protein